MSNLTRLNRLIMYECSQLEIDKSGEKDFHVPNIISVYAFMFDICLFTIGIFPYIVLSLYYYFHILVIYLIINREFFHTI